MTKVLSSLVGGCALLLVAGCTEPANDTATTSGTTPGTEVQGGTVDAPVPTPPVANDTATPAAPAAPAATGTRLTPNGLGAQRVGAAPLASGPDAIAEDGLQISDSCRILRGKGLPGAYFITDGKTIGRVTVDVESKIQTDRGIAVGATEAAVREKYAPLRAEGHKYVPAPGKNLYFEPNGPNGPALRFEIGENGRVTAIHGGVPPILHYVEGCA